MQSVVFMIYLDFTQCPIEALQGFNFFPLILSEIQADK